MTNSILIDPNNFKNLIKNANDMQEILRPHIILDNKIGIYLNILNKIFPTLKNYLILTISSWYFIKKAIFENITDLIVNFIISKASDCWSLFIICATFVAIIFIKKKYK